MNKNFNIIGWDIGGAHLKAVLLDAKGGVMDALQIACPLWRGINELNLAITKVLTAFNLKPHTHHTVLRHAITMTGELVDAFENRNAGVRAIADLVDQQLSRAALFYAGHLGFVRHADVHQFTNHIASANWHASASAVANQIKTPTGTNALWLDIGSTTTDIIAIENNKISNIGLDGAVVCDAYRLQVDSLVYTGVVRTPVMALSQKLPFFDGDDFRGKNSIEVNVMAEYFATMADVYRLTGELASTDDLSETADGKGKTQLESARRLARMIGQDVDNNQDVDNSLEKWIQLAFACKSLQVEQIKQAMLKLLKPNMTIIVAGAGSFLMPFLAERLHPQLTWRHVNEVFLAQNSPVQNPRVHNPHVHNPALQKQVSTCFPAFAVAYLCQHASL